MSRPDATAEPRVVLYVHSDAGLYGSGVSLLELASRLPTDRFSPVVALPAEGPLADALREREVEVETFPLGALRRTFRPDQVAAILWHHAAGARRLADLIRRRGVALVHSNTSHVYSGAAAARRTGRPHIAHVRENLLPPKALARALAGRLWSLSDHVIAISRAAAVEFLGPRSQDPKVRVIYNGVDLSAFSPQAPPAEARQRLGWPRDDPHVGVVGRLTPWKGHQAFLEAAAQVARSHPETRFVIVGDADTPRNQAYKQQLVALADGLGIAPRLRWTGFVRPVQPLMAALDVVVVPSVRPEPFGRAVIEAMAMERPVVATNHGGPTEILAQGGGVLVPPGDPQGLSKAVVHLLGDPEGRLAMAAEGRRQALRRFDISAHVSAVAALYDEALGASPEG